MSDDGEPENKEPVKEYDIVELANNATAEEEATDLKSDATNDSDASEANDNQVTPEPVVTKDQTQQKEDIAAEKAKSQDQVYTTPPALRGLQESLSKIRQAPQTPVKTQPATNSDKNGAASSSPVQLKVPLGTLPSMVDYTTYIPTGSRSVGTNRKVYGKFMKSLEGILFVGEIVGSLLCWILLVVWSYAEPPNYRMPCPMGFSIFVYVTTFVTSTVLFVVLLTGADGKGGWMTVLREPLFGITYNLLCAVAYLIAGGIEASYAVEDLTQVLGASTAFAFVLLIFHTFHALVYFRRRFGKCPWHYCVGCNKECSKAEN